MAGAMHADRERVGGGREAAERERAGDLLRAQDEHEADRAHREPADQRGHERRRGARVAQRRDEAGRALGGGGRGHCCRLADQSRSSKRFATGRILRDDGGVIAYRFGRDDLLRTHFAISPLFELAASLRVLRDPGGHSVHLPWVRDARARLAGARLLADRRAAPERPVRAGLRRAAAADAAAGVRGGARARARDPARAGAARAGVGVRGPRRARGRARAARGPGARARRARRPHGRVLGTGDRAVVGPDPGGAGGRHPPARAPPRGRRRARAVRGARIPTCAGTTAR